MRRTTIVILGSVLLVIVLLCTALFVALIAGRDGTSTAWEPRWDRDRDHWDAPMWEPLEGSRIAPFVAGTLGLLTCLVLAGGLALAGVWLASRGRQRPPAGAEPPGLEALRGRYARGEITREEYLARKDELSR
ncbi:MAG TPA: SHOCT domain-containing protein [Anaerolineae bacterium]|nr:SHOCT domain-containing protein [Anaerolineae bacterium]